MLPLKPLQAANCAAVVGVVAAAAVDAVAVAAVAAVAGLLLLPRVRVRPGSGRGVIWFSKYSSNRNTNIPDTLTPASRWSGAVVVLSLYEAVKREFGGFVQRVFRGFTSTQTRCF